VTLLAAIRWSVSLWLVASAVVARGAPGPVTCPAAGSGLQPQGAVAHFLEGRLAGQRGDAAIAVEELRLAVAFDEGSAELRAALAAALAQAGKFETAELEARRAIACDPTGRAAGAAHLLLGRILLARRQPEPALVELQAVMAVEAARAMAGERGDPEAWRLAAELLVERGELDGAATLLEAAVAAVGADGGGLRELGRTWLERREPERAARALRRAVEVDRGDPEAWRLLALVEERLGHRNEARLDWLALLRLDPENPEALLGLGRLSLLDDDQAAAAEWFRRHLRVVGEGAEPRLRVAMEWLEASRPEEALRQAQEGLAAAPGAPRLLLVAGLALEELRRWREAAAQLSTISPGAGELWFSARAIMAEALARAGRPEEALAALAPALAARPGEPRLVTLQAGIWSRSGRAAEAAAKLSDLKADRARLGDPAGALEIEEALADALVRDQRGDEAVAGLRGAVEANPADTSLRYLLGATLARLGRDDQAEAEMRRLLALDPEHAEALNFLGYGYAERGVRLGEAELLLRRALAAAPRRGHIVDSLGWLLLRRGDVPGAIVALEQAVRLGGPDPVVLEHLGDAYRAAGRAADAAAAWRRALGSLEEASPAEQLKLRAPLERKLTTPLRPVAR
jgi:Flp pilus assembly protein TadD